ncbi:leucine-rich repeat, immunoglobulin-like domain and transmembrane domain-containing protein 2 isoform X2 [Lethenteron reissneri]|uniref:leucine-rich repeat, immunoglobulin-like domain and transmembrane domain-containing protein 2 isoform X2 n=1 Tax=Lethenteron reissneri TaxID=7753 RepID=UPI002AB67A68|nr:leucine-rich repeat, immunoglobulin-like domain and transmembrane domain-containing protein 2 isoform X2 [Lethenteron reissneri]
MEDATMLLALLMLGVSAGRLGGSVVNDTCLLGCTCTSEAADRTILCMAFKDRRIPAWLPADVTKLRVENSPLAEIPNQAFSSAPDLHSLWLNFNNITLIEAGGLEGLGRLEELRLRGNRLRSLPWTAFRHTPRLRLLDLRLNRLDALPEHALRFLSGLAYLDLSSNKLSVASSAVFAEWPVKAAPVAGVGGGAGGAGGGADGVSSSVSESGGGGGSSVVLALHDNPWMCDCRLRGLVEFVREARPPVILMNSYITCAGPELRAGLFFHDLRLSPCARPFVSLDKGNATVAVGREVSVRCTATGRPLPTVAWSYQTTNTRRLQASVVQADEETLLSTLRVAPVLPSDAGRYTCSASSFAGDAWAGFSLTVAVAPRKDGPPAPPAPPDPPPARRSRLDHRGHLGPAGRTRLDLRVSKQGARAVTLTWTCVRIGGGFDDGSGDEHEDVWFSLHYGPADSPTKELVYIGPGVSTYSLSDLRPVSKYEACVLVRDAAPASRHGQCVTFVTGSEESSEMEQREKLIHVVVVVSAMLLIVPAGIFACTWDARAPGCSCCGRRSLSTGVNHAQSRMGDGGVGKSGIRKMKKTRGARWSRDEEEGDGGRGGGGGGNSGGVGGTAIEANAIPFDSLQAASDTELCRKEHVEQTLEGGRTKLDGGHWL